MMKFKTQYDEHQRYLQEPGIPFKITYAPKIDDNGVIDLVATGKENIYEFIQSHKDSVDIHVLLKRFENGEVDVLSRAQGTYGDFSEMPKTYAELLNSVIQGRAHFESLPVEIRAKFDHSFEKYMVAMDDMPSFLEKLGYHLSQDSSQLDENVENSTVSDKGEVKDE